MTEIAQRTGDPIVAPTGVLLGHTDDQRLDRRINARASRIGATLGAIELAGDQTTIPVENGVGLGDTRYIGEEPAAEPIANFSKCATRYSHWRSRR